MSRFQKITHVFLMLSGMLLAFVTPVIANKSDAIVVVTTISPLHSIVSRVMAGAGNPTLLIKQNQSAHHANLKPSQVSKIFNSDLLFWIGYKLETFLGGIINSQSDKNKTLSMLELADIDLLKYPAGGLDPHIWLSTDNARAVGKSVLDNLLLVDQDNSNIYQANFLQFSSDLENLKVEIAMTVDKAGHRKYLVAHDGLQYFAKEYDLQMYPIGSTDGHLAPSAKQIAAARKLVASGEYGCLIVGLDANSAAIRSLAADTSLPIISIDPTGSEITQGPDQYFRLMRSIADKISNCN